MKKRVSVRHRWVVGSGKAEDEIEVSAPSADELREVIAKLGLQAAFDVSELASEPQPQYCGLCHSSDEITVCDNIEQARACPSYARYLMNRSEREASQCPDRLKQAAQSSATQSN